jgi:cytochrome P450
MTDIGTLPDLDFSKPGWSLAMMLDPAYARDPRPYFEALRHNGPARDEFEMEGRRRSVVVTRYDEVEAILRNPKVFSSNFGEGMQGIGNERPLIPLQIDPPDHKKYRVLLDPYLAPRQVSRLEPDITVLVNQLIDRFEARGSCEFTAEFAVPLPCTVFLRLLGLPLEDLDFFLRIKEGIIRGNGELSLTKQQAVRAAAGRECYDYFESALDRIAAERQPGLLLDLLDAEVEGQRLSRDEIMDICYLFIIAGLDTVTDSLCCFWAFLADHPEHRRTIVEAPERIPAAVEELLRFESPVSTVARIAAEDTEIGGCPVRRGENIFVFVGAANTDPGGIPEAGSVDFRRDTNRHWAFGGGIHRCLGSHLARQELRVALREWHRRIPDYSVPAGTELTWTPMLRSVVELPLTFG